MAWSSWGRSAEIINGKPRPEKAMICQDLRLILQRKRLPALKGTRVSIGRKCVSRVPVPLSVYSCSRETQTIVHSFARGISSASTSARAARNRGISGHLCQTRGDRRNSFGSECGLSDYANLALLDCQKYHCSMLSLLLLSTFFA